MAEKTYLQAISDGLRQEMQRDDRVFVLGEYAGRTADEAEVSDPFGGDLDVYRQTCEELERLVAAVAERLVAEGKHGDRR